MMRSKSDGAKLGLKGGAMHRHGVVVDGGRAVQGARRVPSTGALGREVC